ncbi:MFS general substrate transporter [Lentinus tigrinus ALCF2SS1-6]|uniref:MFS general substrate transporter n=1 Tax=Lentinus tigrinus ALCF2SS1-6 TaxID=1328759 RepID=A0A5C2SHX7_9APHY|nr:MFS general substrate transporter [Lentinus tigrinus ALCF2SS1-6]
MDTPRSEKTHVETEIAQVDKALKDVGALSAATSVAPSLRNVDVDFDEYEKGGATILETEIDIPPDGGRGWLVIFGCVIYSAATVGWGYVLVLTVWGVTEQYFKEHVFPDASDSVLSTLGSMSGIFMTLLSVIPGKLADRYGYKPFLAAGGILWTISMLGCAFSTQLWHFFLVMGPVQGIANALVFPLIVALPAQWFLKYRALATGMVVAGSSFGGAVSSLIFREMLSSLGLQKSFAIYTVIDGVLLLAAWFMISERRKPTQRRKIIWFDRSFFSDPVFWSLGLCFFFTVFGYLSPIFLLPTFAKQKLPHLSPLLATLPLTMLNFTSTFGRTFVGFVADRIGPVNTLWSVIMLSGLTQLLVWSFVSSYAGIMAFAITYGLVCGGFLSLTPAASAQLYGSGRLAGLSGLMLLFNLPGNASGAPVGGAILNATGNNWLAVSLYSGSLQIVGATVLLYARFKREAKLFSRY